MTGKEDDISKFRKVIADVYESFIAAVYLVYGFEKAREIVLDVLNAKNYLNSESLIKMVKQKDEEKSININKKLVSNKNYRALLRKFVGKKTQLKYIEKERTDSNVTVVLCISGRQFCIGNGIGLKKAKENAAENACKILLK